MSKQLFVEAALSLQPFSQTRWLKTSCAKHTHGLGSGSHYIFRTSTFHAHTAKGSIAECQLPAATAEANQQFAFSLVANEAKCPGSS